MLVKHVIQAANLAVKGFQKLADVYHLATHIPEAIDGEITKLEGPDRRAGLDPGAPRPPDPSRRHPDQPLRRS